MNHDDLKNELLALEAMEEPVKEKAFYPSGWEPGVIWEGRTKGGTVTSSPTFDGATVDWSEILRERGLDPDVYEVDGDSISWCSYDGWKRDAPGESAYSAMCFSYKARVRLKRASVTGDDTDLLDLYKATKKAHKAAKTVEAETDETLVVNLSDWQIGNGDGGGVITQLEALAALPDLITDRFKQLRRTGRAVNQIVIAGLGDLGEGTCGFYPSQPFLTELDRRQQTRVVRRGITEIVKASAGAAPKVTVTAVGGNHGENRQNMKRLTGFGDNDDVAVFEQVAEIFQESTHDNIAFALPNERLAIALNLHGHIVAWTHGHLAKPQKNAAQAIWDWWKDNTMGRYYPAVADANIVVAGHFHHFNAKEQEGRTGFVCPSLTAVGDWYSNERGVQTVPGTLTFVVNQHGWNSVEILR